MPLEKSTLACNTIATLLWRHYGVPVQTILPLPLGTANCFRVSNGRQDFFLKEFQSGFSETDLVRESRLVNYLADQGFPVPRILPTTAGKAYFLHGSHLVYLQAYVSGRTYENGCLPAPLLLEAAALLGRLHTLLAGYDLPRDMDEKWLASYSPDRAAAQYDHLLQLAESAAGDPHQAQILSDLRYKKALAGRIADYAQYYSGITCRPTHGDFSGLQCICEGSHIKAVVDFSSAKTLPAAWELMRSYVQSSPACKDGTDFCLEEFRAYVRKYMEFAPLTKADLRALPYVYLYQLARSKYGYREYLLSKSENREKLLQFAHWRTSVCRMLEERAAEISAIW